MQRKAGRERHTLRETYTETDLKQTQTTSEAGCHRVSNLGYNLESALRWTVVSGSR